MFSHKRTLFLFFYLKQLESLIISWKMFWWHTRANCSQSAVSRSGQSQGVTVVWSQVDSTHAVSTVSLTSGLAVWRLGGHREVFPAGRDQQIDPLGQQTLPHARILPQIAHFHFPVPQNKSRNLTWNLRVVRIVCVFVLFCSTYRPSEFRKTTFPLQVSRSSMRTRLRSGSLWTRRPELRTSTENPAGGLLKNSSIRVTAIRLCGRLFPIDLSIVSALSSVHQLLLWKLTDSCFAALIKSSQRRVRDNTHYRFRCALAKINLLNGCILKRAFILKANVFVSV